MTFRVVMRDHGGALVDEIPAASEEEARDVAKVQSECQGQRTCRFYVYDGGTRVASFRAGQERSVGAGKRRQGPRMTKPAPPPPKPKSYSVAMYTPTGVHVETRPMPSEDAAITFAVMQWRQRGFRVLDFHVYAAYLSGQRHLMGRFRRGRRLKR